VFLSATAERVASAFNSPEQFRATLNKRIELGTLFSVEPNLRPGRIHDWSAESLSALLFPRYLIESTLNGVPRKAVLGIIRATRASVCHSSL